MVPPSFNFLKSSMISLPWLECRLPVGSSARMILGLATMARAMATSCCCPPESWLGYRSFFAYDLKAVQDVADDAVAFAFFDVAIGQRDVEVLVNGERIQQMIALKDEAEVFLIQLHAVFLVELVDGMLDQVVFAGPGAVVHAK